jgi:hypothetical protein
MLYEWLDCSDSVRNADLIFALAGRPVRKQFALEAREAGLAPRVLLSVGRFEIRGFDKLSFPVPLDLPRIAAGISPEQRHFFVYLEHSGADVELIPKGYFGTLTEIRALRTWLYRHREIRSIVIVSSATHLRRLRMCCRVLLPPSLELRFLGVTGDDPCSRPDLWWQSERTRSAVLWEFPKLVLYWVVLNFGRMAMKIRPRRSSTVWKSWHERAANS